MTTLEERLSRGSEAKAIIEAPVFIEAFEAIEKEIIDKWTNSPARDAEGREKCWQYLTMLRRVREQLQVTMETGKLASLDLQHKQTLADRARAGWRSLTE